jgi:hypothetical protein
MFVFSVAGFSDNIPIGYVAWDVGIPASTGTFDIINQTGLNSSAFPDPTWPVSTTVNLSSLSLTVDFSNGTTTTFGSSYFTLAADGISFNGGVIPIGGANPLPTDATLTGTFSPLTITLNDGSTQTINSSFSATITPSLGTTLSSGDLAVIFATTGSTPPPTVPEPSTWILMMTGLGGIILVRRRNLARSISKSVLPLAIVALAITLSASPSFAQVHLNTWTAPDNGVAGLSHVNITGSGFPSMPIAPGSVTVNFSLSCGGAVAASTTANTIKNIIGTSDRIDVTLPSSLASAIYFVSISGVNGGGTTFGSANCSQVNVTHTNPTLSACVPSSSLGIIAPTSPGPVYTVVPNGDWGGGGANIRVAQLEPGGGPVVPPISIGTGGDIINSCAGNPATGESVCVANNTSVYHLSSAFVPTKLISGSNQLSPSFSGGRCFNCGVAMNALTNQAVIEMGHSGGSGTALQTLDLGNNTFGTPLSLARMVTENISIDPTRGYVLSPNESNVYSLIQFNSSTGAFTGEFGKPIATGGEMDSAAEDCSTGIALSVGEFSNTVILADLTQATFTAGSPGSWTAPSATPSIIGSYAAGLSGVTAPPGTSHLAAVTGEFGGSSFSILQLPSTSGSGTPSIVDYAYVPCITSFSAGFDPHTLSAYTSPNDGKAYVVFANWTTGAPASVAVVDMAAVMARPRMADGHTVIGDPGQGSCLANGDGVVRFVATQ